MRTKFLVSAMTLAGLAATACGSPTSTGQTGQSSGGNQNAQGVTATQITVGTSGPLTGPIAAYGVISQGANAYFNYINAQGGINGRKFKFIILDDQYQPDKGVANARQLVADKVFATVGTLGTAVNQAMDPILLKAGIPVTGVATGSSVLTFPVVPMRWGLQPTYTVEGHVMTKWAIQHNHVKTIGVFYQNDDFGQEGLAAVKQEAAADGAKVVAAIPYNATDTDFSIYAQNMKQANPQAVMEFGVPEPTAQFMKGIQQLGWHPQQYVSDVSGDPIMFKLAGSAFDGVYTNSWMPSSFTDSKLQNFVTEYKKDYANIPPSFLALSGWDEAQVFVHAVQECGNNLSWSNFQKQMDSITNWNGADTAVPVTYSSTNHAGTNQVYMVQADGVSQSMKPISGLVQYVELGSALGQ